MTDGTDGPTDTIDRRKKLLKLNSNVANQTQQQMPPTKTDIQYDMSLCRVVFIYIFF